MPRRPSPTEKFPFEGYVYSDDGQPIGPIDGLFFRGFEKGAELKWRGQFRWVGKPRRSLSPGDSAVLRRVGLGDSGIIIMNVGAESIGFRCCTFGSPLEQS